MVSKETNTLKILRLINNGHKKHNSIIDNFEELDLLQAEIKGNSRLDSYCC
jgi:arginine decarboxylase